MEKISENPKTQPQNKIVTLKTYFKDYCKNSSIQGLSYLVQKNHIAESLWWTIILILCLSGSLIMIYQLVDKWVTTPVLVSLATKEKAISEIPFPAVTICPEAKISNECVDYSKVLRKRLANRTNEVSPDQNFMFDYMSIMCRPENHLETMHLFETDDYMDFLLKCKSINIERDVLCQWMGTYINCENILVPIITDEGLCYTFNMFDVRDVYSDINAMKYFEPDITPPANWDMENGYPPNKLDDVYPRRTFLNGARNALVLEFFTNKSDITYSCRDFAIQGIRVSLHMSTRIPRPSQIFFSVGLNKLTTAAVTPTMTRTAPSVRNYDPHKRNCFYAHERPLKYFKIYTQANCNMECWTNYTIQHCGCVDFYMPRDNNTKGCGFDKRKCIMNVTVSYPTNVLKQKLNMDDDDSGLACDCMPVCNDINYLVELTSSEYDWDNPDNVNNDFVRDETNGFHSSSVKIFFKNSFFLPTEKNELYGVIDFISNTGGILGLFTGFSLFSVAEIIYYLSVRLIENYKKYGHIFGEKESNENGENQAKELENLC